MLGTLVAGMAVPIDRQPSAVRLGGGGQPVLGLHLARRISSRTASRFRCELER